jgi:ComF family protein
MSLDVSLRVPARRPRRIRPSGWASALFDLVFPPQCVACAAALEDGTAIQICASCREEIDPAGFVVCPRCASRLPANPFEQHCRLCFREAFRFERAIALGNYRGRLRELIYQFKRRNQEPVAFQLGRLLGRRALDQLGSREHIDAVVPMPSHRLRQWTRGMNPALVVAEGVIAETGCELIAGMLRYRRHTAKQGTLSRAKRLKNVRGAMGTNARFASHGMRVLLVDDVMASGATINEAARALRVAGVGSILVAVIGRGTGST